MYGGIIVEGQTHLDRSRNLLVARIYRLRYRMVEYPKFVVPDWSDPSVIKAHVAARFDMPDRYLYVDFGGLRETEVDGQPIPVQEWAVWSDMPWSGLSEARPARQQQSETEPPALASIVA